MAVTDFSTTAGNNNSAPPNGFPEGQSPSSLNDACRQLMASIAVEAQVNAVKVLASVAGTDTITGSMTPDLTAYSAGMYVVLTPANNNTGAATLNIDTLGALDILKYDGDALVSGDLVAGVPAFLVLDSGADDFYLLNPQTNTATVASGTYTPTLTNTTNISSSTARVCQYMRVGSVVTVSGTVNITTTSGGGDTVLGMSLPIASDFTVVSQLGGAGGTRAAATNIPMWAQADTTNNRAVWNWGSFNPAAAAEYGFTFTYLIA